MAGPRSTTPTTQETERERIAAFAKEAKNEWDKIFTSYRVYLTEPKKITETGQMEANEPYSYYTKGLMDRYNVAGHLLSHQVRKDPSSALTFEGLIHLFEKSEDVTLVREAVSFPTTMVATAKLTKAADRLLQETVPKSSAWKRFADLTKEEQTPMLAGFIPFKIQNDLVDILPAYPPIPVNDFSEKCLQFVIQYMEKAIQLKLNIDTFFYQTGMVKATIIGAYLNRMKTQIMDLAIAEEKKRFTNIPEAKDSDMSLLNSLIAIKNSEKWDPFYQYFIEHSVQPELDSLKSSLEEYRNRKALIEKVNQIIAIHSLSSSITSADQPEIKNNNTPTVQNKMIEINESAPQLLKQIEQHKTIRLISYPLLSKLEKLHDIVLKGILPESIQNIKALDKNNPEKYQQEWGGLFQIMQFAVSLGTLGDAIRLAILEKLSNLATQDNKDVVLSIVQLHYNDIVQVKANVVNRLRDLQSQKTLYLEEVKNIETLMHDNELLLQKIDKRGLRTLFFSKTSEQIQEDKVFQQNKAAIEKAKPRLDKLTRKLQNIDTLIQEATSELSRIEQRESKCNEHIAKINIALELTESKQDANKVEGSVSVYSSDEDEGADEKEDNSLTPGSNP